MKKLLPLLLLSFLWANVSADTYSFNKFSGLNTDDSPLQLENGQTPDSENVITDDGPGVQGRKGFISFATQTPVGMWEFPKSDGTRYLIANVGTRLLADTGAGTFTTLISTVPSDRTVAGSVLGDRFYFVDTLNGLKYWDSSSVSVASASLKVDKLVTWKGRLVAAGLTASQRVIFLSKYLDGTTWTAPTNPSDDDAAIITVSGALDENIQALFASYKDLLVWFKKNSFGGIYGSRRSNFTQRTFSDYIGVANPETIRDCDGLLRWLGNNRVVWEFDGATYKKISEQVDTLFSAISQGDSSSKSNTQTTQTQFEAGTQSPTAFLDTSLISGSLVPKTSYFIETDAVDFGAGSCSPSLFCDTTTVPGSFRVKIATQPVTTGAQFGAGTFDNTINVDTETAAALLTVFPDTFDYFRNGSGTKNFYATSVPACGSMASVNGRLRTTGTGCSGDQAYFNSRTTLPPTLGSGGTTYYFEISSFSYTGAGAQSPEFLLSNTVSSNIISLAQAAVRAALDFSETSATTIKVNNFLAWNAGAAGTAGAATINLPINTTFTMPLKVKLWINASNYTLFIAGAGSSSSYAASHTWSYAPMYTGFAFASLVDNWTEIDNFSVAPQTFTYTSASIDTGMSLPTWGYFTSDWSGSTITYTTQVSADNSSFDSAVAVTTGSLITSAKKRYIKLNALFNYSPSTYPATAMLMNDFTPAAFATGTFTSRTFDTGYPTPIYSALATSTTTTGTAETFNYFTQSSNDGSSWDARVAASSGTVIASTKKRYVRYQIDAIPTATTNYVTVDNLSFNVKSTGTFTTQTITVGTLVSAWGPLSASLTNNGGGFTLQFATSTDGSTFGTYATVVNNAAPTISTAPYARARLIFDLDVTTDTPQADDITLNWSEGSTIRAASAYINQRYWLAVALGSTSNNRVFVFDKNRQWQRYSGINIDAATLYNSHLYFGNTSGIFQAESGYSDNSASISAYYQSPTVGLGGLDSYVKFLSLYTTTDASDSTLTGTYQLEGVATNYALGSSAMNSTTGIQNLKFPFPIEEINQGRLISLKWSIPGTSFWRVLNGNLVYDRDTIPY